MTYDCFITPPPLPPQCMDVRIFRTKLIEWDHSEAAKKLEGAVQDLENELQNTRRKAKDTRNRLQHREIDKKWPPAMCALRRSQLELDYTQSFVRDEVKNLREEGPRTLGVRDLGPPTQPQCFHTEYSGMKSQEKSHGKTKRSKIRTKSHASHTEQPFGHVPLVDKNNQAAIIQKIEGHKKDMGKTPYQTEKNEQACQIGELYLLLGRYSRALKSFRKAIVPTFDDKNDSLGLGVSNTDNAGEGVGGVHSEAVGGKNRQLTLRELRELKELDTEEVEEREAERKRMRMAHLRVFSVYLKPDHPDHNLQVTLDFMSSGCARSVVWEGEINHVLK